MHTSIYAVASILRGTSHQGGLSKDELCTLELALVLFNIFNCTSILQVMYLCHWLWFCVLQVSGSIIGQHDTG